MANSINKIIILGNLGNDAEFRTTTSGLELGSFSVATTNSYKDKADQWVNETTWHRVTAFKPSEYVKDKLKRGSQVLVEGRIKTGEYTDKEGIKRYTTDIIAEKIVPCGERSEGQNQQSAPATAPTPAANEDDDLPF